MTKRKAGPMSDTEEARVQGMIARDPDAPEVTPEEAAQARPASEALDPALFAALTRRGRPKSESAKKLVTLRLPPGVIEGYQAGGPGWQVRMGEVLAAGLEPRGKRTSRVGPAAEGRYIVTGPEGGKVGARVTIHDASGRLLSGGGGTGLEGRSRKPRSV